MNQEKIFELREYRDRILVFRDRTHAGEILSLMLQSYKDSDSLVFAIPAGGVPVAAPISRNLGLKLDLAVASKITLPWSTESGYGAVAFDGTVKLNEKLITYLGLGEDVVQSGITRTAEKVTRRLESLRGHRPMADFRDRPVILVDDGLASGITMSVTVEAVRKGSASRIIIAVPTAHLEATGSLIDRVDALYCPNIRSGDRYAVADAYENWYDVPESEAKEILRRVDNSGGDQRI